MTKNYADKVASGEISIEEAIPIKLYSHQELVEKLKTLPAEKVIPTGLNGLDALINGFKAGRLYVLSAPPKNGKTTLAQTFMFNLALMGSQSMMFTYEMSWQEMTRKFMEMDQFCNKTTTSDLPLYMPMEHHRDSGELQFSWIESAIKKGIEENNIKLVVIDHLHFLLPLKETKNTSFVIGGIMRELKKICNLLNIPIILIAHIAKLENEKIPTYRDIRDSSFIAQESDVTMIMWRLRDKNAPKTDSDEIETETYTQKAYLSVELDRVKGASGRIKLWHNGVMFEEYNNQDIKTIKIGGICTEFPMK